MMKVLFKQTGTSLDIDILGSVEAQEFIDAHATVLDSAFESVRMTDVMRQRLQKSDWIFSGIKTFHELNEAFPSLLDENGNRKPFERFLNDVLSIDKTYNRNYLRAEYNFVQSSAEMAAKWEQYSEDGDRYLLQYRTAGDERVRPAHAALNGITLPRSDEFWNSYYPPNGWNCRCTVVQVRRSKYPETSHEEAMSRGEEALADDKKGIFRFNSGKEQKAVPDYNAYTIRRCRDCIVAKGKENIELAKEVKPQNTDLCKACQWSRAIQSGDRKIIRPLARKHLQGKYINNPEFEHDVQITGRTIKEWLNQPHNHYQEKNAALLRIKSIFKKAEYCGSTDYKERCSHLFIIDIAGEENILLVHQYETGEFNLYGVSDSKKLLEIAKEIKRKR